jgi:hypothetical protein
MRTLLGYGVVTLSTLLIACPPSKDSADTAEGDTDTDADSDSDTDTDADADADTDADADADTDADTDLPLTVAELQVGDLIITEIMAQPTLPDADAGEWFELHNATGTSVDLTGLRILVGGVEAFVAPSGLLAPPAAFVVFARSEQIAAAMDVELLLVASGVTLGDQDDTLALANDAVIDEVSWDLGFPLEPGAALSLDPDRLDALDNDDAQSWCAATEDLGTGDLGSPGAANPQCPEDADGDGFLDTVDCDDSDAAVYPGAEEVWYDGVDQDCSGGSDYDADDDGEDSSAFGGGDCDDGDPAIGSAAVESDDGLDNDCDDMVDEGFRMAGELVITEIMYNPSTTEPDTEWLELHNPDLSRDLQLDGVLISSSSSGGRQFWVAPGSASIPAGGFVVLCHGDSVLGSACDYVYGSDVNPGSSQGATFSASFALGNSSAVTVSVSLDGTTLDEVIYNDGSGWPSSTNGAAVGLDPALHTATDNDSGASWCHQTSTHGSGDTGTPGVLNDDCGLFAPDDDGDGFTTATDCDDTDATVFPGAVEVFYDGVDQDCSGGSDYDADGDGEDSDAWGGADCDDADASVYPGAPDASGDGIDQDCDGVDGSTSSTDLDGDGHDSTVDCDDRDASVHPGAAEADNDLDDDCDDMVDEGWRVAGDLVISEIMYNPSTTEPDTEWLELYNPDATRDLVLDGLKVYSSSSSGRQFWVAPGSLVIPAGGYVVLCHGDTVLGASCDYVYGTDVNPVSTQGASYSASFALGNSGAVTLTLSLDGTTLDEVIYNDGSGWPSSSNGKSVGLSPTLLDASSNDTGSSWCHQTSTHGSGDYGTPALANDTCAP